MTIGSFDLVSRTVKGCGNLVPPHPKYDFVWDVSSVLQELENWGKNEDLSLLQLSKKLTMLLLLCTSQRGQTIWHLPISGLFYTDFGAKFHMKHQLKTNAPGDRLSCIKLYAYDDNRRLCPVRCLKHYIRRTNSFRHGKDQLLLTSKSPNRPVARNTVSKWTKAVFKEVGICTKRFGSHSTRSASASAALSEGININTLMQQASW